MKEYILFTLGLLIRLITLAQENERFLFLSILSVEAELYATKSTISYLITQIGHFQIDFQYWFC